MIDWIRKEEAPVLNNDTLVLVFSPSWHKQYRVMPGCYVKLHPDITHWAYLRGPSLNTQEKQEGDFLTEAQRASIKDQWDSIQKDLENDT